tara:strand:- start:400 stop:828 length:429 start_codon:yes stop_codon:yes gene_type:complete
MGYTHYWRQYDGFNSDKWDTLVQHSLHLQAAVYPSAKLADVEMSDFRISFNGVKPQNHEYFVLDRVMSPPNSTDVQKEHYFDFCKTAQKPYDLMVMCVLLVANALEPDVITYATDGAGSDWQPAIDLVNKVCNLDVSFNPND